MKLPPWLRIGVWTLVVALGVAAFGAVAWSRGEPVNALWLIVASGCVFAVAWRFHSAWLIAKVLTLDETRATPAVVHEDGKDYVKTNKWMVFGHHFAAIAGPGPLVGPVLAAQFGYLPGMLWILVGATLGGAVHDSIILFCSIRRRGKSLGQMVGEEVGPFAGRRGLREHSGDHGHPARGAVARGGQGAGGKSLGPVHHRGHDAAGARDGAGIALLDAGPDRAGDRVGGGRSPAGGGWRPVD